jgi:ADP-ribose pyrophosphatase YjhB (NUDIX family)
MERHHFPIVTAGGLLRDENKDVLLVRTQKWSNLWGIPGGKVEYGETVEAAFLREILEETGLRAFHPRFVMMQDAIEHPEFFQPRHFVLINYVADVAGARPSVRLNDEAQESLWIPLQDASRMPLNGPTLLLLEKIRKNMEKNVGQAIERGGEDSWTC